MTVDEFRSTAAAGIRPEGMTPALQALWEDARGNWSSAHDLAQNIDGKTGAWVHAYLHRKEGDASNAGYWYRRAGQPPAEDSLEKEWERLVKVLLEDY